MANEAVDSRKKPDVLYKLDLEKAYHHVNGKFLDFMTMKMGIEEKWKKLVSFCISSVRYKVEICVGLRQGDFLLFW